MADLLAPALTGESATHYIWWPIFRTDLKLVVHTEKCCLPLGATQMWGQLKDFEPDWGGAAPMAPPLSLYARLRAAQEDPRGQVRLLAGLFVAITLGLVVLHPAAGLIPHAPEARTSTVAAVAPPAPVPVPDPPALVTRAAPPALSLPLTPDPLAEIETGPRLIRVPPRPPS